MATTGLSWGIQASIVVLRGLSCSKAHGILVPWPGIEPMSPALQGRFLTTGLPGKSLTPIFLNQGSEFPDLCSHPPNPTSQDFFWSRWWPNYFSPTCWSLCLKCSRPAHPTSSPPQLLLSWLLMVHTSAGKSFSQQGLNQPSLNRVHLWFSITSPLTFSQASPLIFLCFAIAVIAVNTLTTYHMPSVLQGLSFFFFSKQFSLFIWPHFEACGILAPHQGSNPCPLHWNAES